MKKGEWLVCVTDDFKSFTKGKKYQLLKDVNGTVLEIENDRGYRARPSLNGYDSGKIITYFMSIKDIREKKLNQIL
jgi:hypothetical protein